MDQHLLDELKRCFELAHPGFTPRAGQLEACAEVIEAFDSVKFVVFEGPTGSGKSVIGATIAKYYERRELRTVFTTVTKELQNQYLREYPFADIRGNSNEKYRCQHGVTRAELECKVFAADNECNTARVCPYRKAVAWFLKAPVAITNLQFFSRVPFVGETFLGIHDECHEMANTVIGFAEVALGKIDLDLLEETIGKPEAAKVVRTMVGELKQQFEELPEDFVGPMFDVGAAAAIANVLEAAIERAEKNPLRITSSSRLRRAYMHTKAVTKRLMPIIDLKGSQVVKTGQYELKPLYAAAFTDDIVFKKTRRVLCMSATVCGPEAYCEEVGIPLDDVAFVSMPHTIPVEARPVDQSYVANMKAANYSTDIKKAAKRVGELIREHDHVNTLIHTASYQRADDLAEICKAHDGITIHVPRSHDEIVKLLKSADKGVFVASPSAVAGIDGKYDMIRLNIILKMPFPSLGDPRMRYLSRVNPDIYALKVARDLVQASGRGTRAADDFSNTYVLDGVFKQFLERNKRLFPYWWREAVRTF